MRTCIGSDRGEIGGRAFRPLRGASVCTLHSDFLDTGSVKRVAWFHSPVAISRHPSTSVQIAWSTLRARRPKGTARSTFNHRDGWTRSRPTRDSPRRPDATRGNGTKRPRVCCCGSAHHQPHRSAPPRAGKQTLQGPLRAIPRIEQSLQRHGRRRARDYLLRFKPPREPIRADVIRRRRQE